MGFLVFWCSFFGAGGLFRRQTFSTAWFEGLVSVALIALVVGTIGFVVAYLYRISVPFQKENPKGAENVLREAAQRGDAVAQHDLGLLYYDGKGVTQDYAEAAIWYGKAAAQGELKSQVKLGSLYMNGQGVPQDYEEAYFWLILAATCGKGSYATLRDQASRHLTPQQVSSVQTRARQWNQTPATTGGIQESLEACEETTDI